MRNGNIVWPITLIAVGAVFLAYNLGFIAFAQIRDIVGTWWPLILIALGIGGLFQRRK